MHIWVDADACPKVIKEILYRAADRVAVGLTLVANQPLQVPGSQYIRSVQVAPGFELTEQSEKARAKLQKLAGAHLFRVKVPASGAVELIASVLAVHENRVHPTINYETPDPECDLDYVPNEAREMQVRNAVSNSLGFGGHNASLLVGDVD